MTRGEEYPSFVLSSSSPSSTSSSSWSLNLMLVNGSFQWVTDGNSNPTRFKVSYASSGVRMMLSEGSVMVSIVVGAADAWWEHSITSTSVSHSRSILMSMQKDAEEYHWWRFDLYRSAVSFSPDLVSLSPFTIFMIRLDSPSFTIHLRLMVCLCNVRGLSWESDEEQQQQQDQERKHSYVNFCPIILILSIELRLTP